MSSPPVEGTYSLVDNGTAGTFGAHRAAAVFEGGQWVRAGGKPLPFQPTYWMAFRDE